MSPERFEVIHNIPSPYRLHLFSALGTELEKHGIAMRVHFMSRGHADRFYWGEAAPAFEHVFWADRGTSVGGKEWHLNPGLILQLLRERPAFLLVGGPWDSVTAAMVSLLSCAKTFLAWLEVNTKTPGRTDRRSLAIKKLLISRYSGVVVPGADAERYTRTYLTTSRPVFKLPNLVDERRFRSASSARRDDTRRRLGVRGGERLAIWPARFIPAKGILEFLHSLRPQALRSWRLLLVGAGPLEAQIRAAIQEAGLADVVHLLPPVPYTEMPMLYQASDLFVLPSLSDPNPLSVIEAMHVGLPLLLSSRVGNVDEALEPGRNGWRFDPTDPRSVEAACDMAFTCAVDDLRRRGDASRQLAIERWSTDRAISSFVDSLLRRRSFDGELVAVAESGNAIRD